MSGEHRQMLDALDGQAEQVLRGRIAPVHVLVGEQHRLCRREPVQLIDQRFQRQLLPSLRGEVKGWIAIVCRQAEQGRDQRHRLIEAIRAARKKRLQLGKSQVGRIVAREAGAALQLLDQRMERASRVMGRALIEQAQMRLVGQPFTHLAHQARLADPRLPREQHHLAFALTRLPPPTQQQRDLLLAADQGRKTGGLTRLEAVFGSALARDPKRRQWLGEALEALRAKVVELEQATQ